MQTNTGDLGESITPTNRDWAIFLVSVLGLFLEMMLIRWIGTEIRIFAYLQNSILVACFLGLGLGCFTSKQPILLKQSLFPLLILLVLMAIPNNRNILESISILLSMSGDMVIWYEMAALPPWATTLGAIFALFLTYVLLILVVDMFVPIGRMLGRVMDEHPNTIWAYSLNIAGSIAGTWLFVLLSFFYQPPVTWFVVLGAIFLVFFLLGRRDRAINIVLMVAIVVLAVIATLQPGALESVWSPYQKLVLRPIDYPDPEPVQTAQYVITVNNVGYQVIQDQSKEFITAHNHLADDPQNSMSQYDLPLLFHLNPQSMLIVGAGSGNDASGGLRHNVAKITAVEIDPAIINLGKKYHPEQPYQNPALKVVIDDARSFFAKTGEKYDVIAFGLLDSHTTTAMTNARLDHYVYTRESIQRAKSLLAEDGVMTLSFALQRPYIGDRMAGVLREVFGEEPLVFDMPNTAFGCRGTMFVAGNLEGVRAQIAQNQQLAAMIGRWQELSPRTFTYTTKIATDDWPYIYLEKPSIPPLFFLIAGLMLLILFRSARRWKAADLVGRWQRSHWHFFFLGAAFLLLEVQNISKASVVMGNTWQVNAVIVTGVLCMALLANFIAYRFPKFPVNVAYIALIGTCLGLYFVDLARFAFLPYPVKAVIVGGLTAMPMLFSGIIFVRSFAAVENKDEALGANLVGSLVGALLQSITFITGIKALLLIVAGLYFASLLALPGEQLEEASRPAEDIAIRN